MKLKELRLKANKTQEEVSRAVGIDTQMLSRFENYKCLPTPPTMERLCEVLNFGVDDAYEPHEIYYRKTRKSKPIKENCYKLTVRLPREAKKVLKNIQDYGYTSVTEWIRDCYEKLKKCPLYCSRADEKRGI